MARELPNTNPEYSTKDRLNSLQRNVDAIYKGWNVRNIDEFRALPASTLLKTILDHRNLAQKTFLKNPRTQGFSESDLNTTTPLSVDFRGNNDAEHFIGLGSLLSIHQRVIEVTDLNGQKRVGIRKTTPRVGYYDAQGYIPVYTGYQIRLCSEPEFTTLQTTEKDPTFKKELSQYTYSLSQLDTTVWKKSLDTEQNAHKQYATKVLATERSLASLNNNPSLQRPIYASKEHQANLELFQGNVPMDRLTAEQAYALGRKVFGNGPGARILELLDSKREGGAGEGKVVTRMIALAAHEGSLKFQRTNVDPNVANGKVRANMSRGYTNKGTFQIFDPVNVEKKYSTCLQDGIRKYVQLTGEPITLSSLSSADQDVLAHVGYILGRGKNLFQKMSQPNLNEEELIRLMHYRVQGGIRKIGEEVANITLRGKKDGKPFRVSPSTLYS